MHDGHNTTGAAATDGVTGAPRDSVLSGVRVLEFCHTIMGPSCGLVLADLGADVIKVEPAPDGDRTRRLQGFVSGSFSYFNRNKRSIGINLKTAEGRELAHRMVRDADVLIENYGPGTAERLGLGYDELAALNPRLIYCSLKGFLPGPYEGRTALDEVVQYMSGLAYMTGPPGQPMRAGASVVDILGGVFGALAILAALRRRDQTGLGSKVQSALFETAAFLVGQHMAAERVMRSPVQPLPVRRRSWAIYETFVAAGGERLFLGLTSNRHWEIFCEIFERPDLFADPRFATNELRLAEHDTLQPIVAALVATRPGRELVDVLAESGIPASLVARPGDLFDDPHLNSNGRLLPTMLANGDIAPLPRLPIAIGELDLGMYMQPPALGEHTHEIMARYGYADREIDALMQRGVLA